jgi:hypothetical protein
MFTERNVVSYGQCCRRRLTIACQNVASAFMGMSLAGCAGSPTQNVFGSFFPSWMLCVLVGLILTVATHRVLAVTRVAQAIPAPFLVYLSLAVAFTLAMWLVWLG